MAKKNIQGNCPYNNGSDFTILSQQDDPRRIYCKCNVTNKYFAISSINGVSYPLVDPYDITSSVVVFTVD